MSERSRQQETGKRGIILLFTIKPGHDSAKIPLLNILWAQVDDKKNVVVSLLAPGKGKWALRHAQGELPSTEETLGPAEEWTKSLMDVAYAGKPSLRVR